MAGRRAPGKLEGSHKFFRITDSLSEDPDSSDVIVAHSAGCYFVPKDTKAKLIILIGLPFWPKRPLIVCLALKLWWEIGHHRQNKDFSWWLNKMAHNILYIFTKPSVTYKSLVNRWRKTLPMVTSRRKIFIVRNADDPFTHPDLQNILPITAGYDFVELPGGHDDCWSNPKPYIDLLLKEL